jgi:transcriptional regulator with XRE-family HTH domain
MKNRLGVELGLKIRQLREDRGLTQSDVAELSKKSVETISNFERGQTVPSVETLDKLAQIFRIGIGAFFDKHPTEDRSVDGGLQTRLKLLEPNEIEIISALIDA